MSTPFNERLSTTYATGYEQLQQRFTGQIEVVETIVEPVHLDPAQLTGNPQLKANRQAGFSDISAPAADLVPLIGRVLLYPNQRTRQHQPAVITQSQSLQLTILNQPYDPRIGITEGILFGLGLKHDTQQQTFGAHTAAQGFEAGHVAPAMVALRVQAARRGILQNGDKGTHAIGRELGGIPETMAAENLLDALPLRTVDLDMANPRPIPLAWHDTLERDEGVMWARYRGPTSAVKLMLGAASNKLGERVIDELGELTAAAIGGA